ncbi:hypothetical protein [Microbacterium sp.]|uniref:hypothetical protein n=1 Tax=Microbacterium sp. TaxID=51671 RepID=UPI00333E8AF1
MTSGIPRSAAITGVAGVVVLLGAFVAVYTIGWFAPLVLLGTGLVLAVVAVVQAVRAAASARR